MFSGLTVRLETEVAIVQQVLAFHDRIRTVLNEAPIVALDDEHAPSFLETVQSLAPRKSAWQVYDHCAAFTRLYGIYAQFVEDLVADYLVVLPKLFANYAGLPERITTQHRIGIAQILSKIGTNGPYRHLQETTIVQDLASAVRGDSPYKLLKDAFFLERQNYRLDALGRLFGSLGIEHLSTKLLENRFIQAVVNSKPEGFSVEKELSDFVQYRNIAAHSQVDQIVSVETVAGYGELLVALCKALGDIVEDEILHRQVKMGNYVQVGTVTETFSHGVIVVAQMAPGTLKLGEKLAVVYHGTVKIVLVESIRVNNITCLSVKSTAGGELGLKLSMRCRRESLLAKVAFPSGTPVATGERQPVSAEQEEEDQNQPNSDEIEDAQSEHAREEDI